MRDTINLDRTTSSQLYPAQNSRNEAHNELDWVRGPADHSEFLVSQLLNRSLLDFRTPRGDPSNPASPPIDLVAAAGRPGKEGDRRVGFWEGEHRT
jgi:hypothetical protein